MATIVAIIKKDADTIVRLLCLEDRSDGGTITGATVTVTINDAAGAPLAGVVWAITMLHTTKGTYTGSVPDTLVVTVGQVVDVVVTADDGPGRRRLFHKSVTVEEG